MNRISKFYLQVCHERIKNRKFCIASPDTTFSSETDKKVDIFLKYHLAITPDVPVILFALENTYEVGSPLFRYSDGSVVYHIPPKNYETLEECIEDSEFIVSEQLASIIIGSRKAHASIFDCLSETHKKIGLNVLGVYNATEETEV